MERRKRIGHELNGIVDGVYQYVEEALSRAWNQLLARPGGAFQFRFILQPLLAVIIAIRAGMKDGRTHRTPYLRGLLSRRAERRLLVRSTLKDVGRLFMMAVVLDCLYQIMEIRHIYPLQALIVGVVLAIIPYVIVRGPVARIVNRSVARRDLTTTDLDA